MLLVIQAIVLLCTVTCYSVKAEPEAEPEAERDEPQPFIIKPGIIYKRVMFSENTVFYEYTKDERTYSLHEIININEDAIAIINHSLHTHTSYRNFNKEAINNYLNPITQVEVNIVQPNENISVEIQQKLNEVILETKLIKYTLSNEVYHNEKFQAEVFFFNTRYSKRTLCSLLIIRDLLRNIPYSIMVRITTRYPNIINEHKQAQTTQISIYHMISAYTTFDACELDGGGGGLYMDISIFPMTKYLIIYNNTLNNSIIAYSLIYEMCTRGEFMIYCPSYSILQKLDKNNDCQLASLTSSLPSLPKVCHYIFKKEFGTQFIHLDEKLIFFSSQQAITDNKTIIYKGMGIIKINDNDNRDHNVSFIHLPCYNNSHYLNHDFVMLSERRGLLTTSITIYILITIILSMLIINFIVFFILKKYKCNENKTQYKKHQIKEISNPYAVVCPVSMSTNINNNNNNNDNDNDIENPYKIPPIPRPILTN